MVALLSFVALLLPVLLARTSPVLTARSQVQCQAQRTEHGVSVGNDVTRFVFKYADAQRWKQSTPMCISEVVFQQVLSSYFPTRSSTNPLYRTFLQPAPSPAQVRYLRTASIAFCMFRTPFVLEATLPLSSGSFSTSFSLITPI